MKMYGHDLCTEFEDHPGIKQFIENYKNTNPALTSAVVEAHTNGLCYHFSLILQDLYRGGEIYYEQMVGHFVYKYGDHFYDITGEVNFTNSQLVKWSDMSKYDYSLYLRLLSDCVYKISR